MNKAHSRMVLGLLSVWIITLPLSTLPFTAQAQVYKWKDKNGATQYSDMPPHGSVPFEIVDKTKSMPQVGGSPSPASDQSARNAAALRRQVDAEQEKTDQNKANTENQAKQENCNKAKSEYQKYKQGGRIYQMSPEGERHYLGDEELKNGLERATQEVEQFCGTE